MIFAILLAAMALVLVGTLGRTITSRQDSLTVLVQGIRALVLLGIVLIVALFIEVTR